MAYQQPEGKSFTFTPLSPVSFNGGLTPTIQTPNPLVNSALSLGPYVRGYNSNRDYNNGYYDCSSFIWDAARRAGYIDPNTPAFTTLTAPDMLVKTGNFTQINKSKDSPISSLAKPGDIVGYNRNGEGHMALVGDDGRIIQVGGIVNGKRQGGFNSGIDTNLDRFDWILRYNSLPKSNITPSVANMRRNTEVAALPERPDTPEGPELEYIPTHIAANDISYMIENINNMIPKINFNANINNKRLKSNSIKYSLRG